MGQYHKLVNIDKEEVIHPHEMGQGLKLMEQYHSNYSTQHALMLLLTRDNGLGGGDFYYNEENTKEVLGRWVGDRVFWAGDYGDKNEDYYSLSEDYDDISSMVLGAMKDIGEWE